MKRYTLTLTTRVENLLLDGEAADSGCSVEALLKRSQMTRKQMIAYILDCMVGGRADRIEDEAAERSRRDA